jgi:AdoMet-dependent heme synthase
MSAPSPTNTARLVVVWRITEVCDLGCAFCGYSREVRRPRAVANPVQVLALGGGLGEYARTQAREVLVSWLGGEPLRWPPLLDVARTYRREFGLRVSVTTHGLALEAADVRRRLVEDFDELTVSVDGPPAVHDALRGQPGLADRLHDAMLRLRDLTERAGHGPRLRVNMVLMRDNVRWLEAVGRTAAAWGGRELTFNALGGRDRPEFYPEHRLLPEHIAWLRQALPGIRARLALLGLTLRGSEQYLERLAASAEGRALPAGEGQPVDCRAGQQFLFIDERGRVSACSHTPPSDDLGADRLASGAGWQDVPGRLADSLRRTRPVACSDCLSTQVFGKYV